MLSIRSGSFLIVSDTLIHRFGTDGPAYIRKLDKKSTWGDRTDTPEERLIKTVDGVFPSSGEPQRYSFYWAASDEELKRIVVALNGFRHRKNDKIDFIAFTKDELVSANISICEVPGDTECKAANRLHIDVKASVYKAYSSLCQMAFSVNRVAFRVSKPEAKAMWQELDEHGCEAIDTNSNCRCTE